MALSLISFVSGTSIESSEVNSNFSAINAELFDISNANIAASAGIVDTKLAQIVTANKVHGSSLVAGSIDGVSGQFAWYIDGAGVVGDSYGPIFIASAALTPVNVLGWAKTPPTGASFIIDVMYDDQLGGGFTTLFVTKPEWDAAANGLDGNHAFIASPTIVSGGLLRFDVDQIGSSTPGSDLTFALVVEQAIP